MSWFTESNRDKHFFGGFLLGLFINFWFAIGVGWGMEFKDEQYGNKFDLLDFTMTSIGGLIGYIIKIFIINLI